MKKIFYLLTCLLVTRQTCALQATMSDVKVHVANEQCRKKTSDAKSQAILLMTVGSITPRKLNPTREDYSTGVQDTDLDNVLTDLRKSQNNQHPIELVENKTDSQQTVVDSPEDLLEPTAGVRAPHNSPQIDAHGVTPVLSDDIKLPAAQQSHPPLDKTTRTAQLIAIGAAGAKKSKAKSVKKPHAAVSPKRKPLQPRVGTVKFQCIVM